MKEHLDKSRQTQNVLRVFEARDRSTQEHNFERVNFWSGIQLFVMVSVSLMQVLMIRSLFITSSTKSMKVSTWYQCKLAFVAAFMNSNRPPWQSYVSTFHHSYHCFPYFFIEQFVICARNKFRESHLKKRRTQRPLRGLPHSLSGANWVFELSKIWFVKGIKSKQKLCSFCSWKDLYFTQN